MSNFFYIFNIRFFLFIAIAFSPLWAGLISIAVVMLQQKLGLIDIEED